MAQEATSPESPERRRFLGSASAIAMGGGMLAGYGAFFATAGRYLYPAHGTPTAWMFVTELDRMPVGSSRRYITPAGASVVITRRTTGASDEAFLALSSTCPHLGCQVNWEEQNNRFFCPCHNGVFTPEGKGVGGPPGDAGQSLPTYPLKVDRGLLYIEVPIDAVARAEQAGDGHDPCLKGHA